MLIRINDYCILWNIALLSFWSVGNALCDKIALSNKIYLQPVYYYFEAPICLFLIKALHSPLWINITLTFQRIGVQNKRQTAGQQNSHLHCRSCTDIIIGCNISACSPSWFHLSPERHNEQRSQGTNDQVAGSFYEALDVALYQNAGFDLAAKNLSCGLQGLKLDGYNNNCGPLRDPLLRYFPSYPNNSPFQKETHILFLSNILVYCTSWYKSFWQYVVWGNGDTNAFPILGSGISIKMSTRVFHEKHKSSVDYV